MSFVLPILFFGAAVVLWPVMARARRAWRDRPDPAWDEAFAKRGGQKRRRRQKYDYEKAVAARHRAEQEAAGRRLVANHRTAYAVKPKAARGENVTPMPQRGQTR